MRPAVSDSKKHKARGVSLPPDMSKLALAKASRLNMSFSEYVQRLIGYDLKNNVLAQMLAEDARKAA